VPILCGAPGIRASWCPDCGEVDADEQVVLVATGGYGGTDAGGSDGGTVEVETVTRERLAAALGVRSTDSERENGE